MSAQQIEMLARLFTAPAPEGRVTRALEAREAMQRHRQGRPLAFPSRPLVTDEQATGLRLYPERGRTVHAEGIPTNAARTVEPVGPQTQRSRVSREHPAA